MQALAKRSYQGFPTLCVGAVIALVSSLLSGCSEAPKIETIEGFAQGTTYHVSFWSEDAVSVEAIKATFDSTLAQIDKELSTYRPDSYISKFNHSPSTDWQAASTDFIELIELAKDINKKSQGCYDPTIAPLFDLWGFKKDQLHVPSAAELAATKAKLGLDKIKVDPLHERIRKTMPLIQLDLSSMGEGYTIGKLSEELDAKGVHNYLVEFGGDMKIKGKKPNGDAWRIAIERPVAKGTTPDQAPQVYKTLKVKDESGVTLDTSGTYNRYFDKNGVAYSHILNPATGQPVRHDLVSASVFGTDPRVSDAWATTMLCLGPVEGAKIAQQQNLEVFFIENKHGTLVDSSSAALTNSARVTFDQD